MKMLGQDLITQEEFDKFKAEEFISLRDDNLVRLKELSKKCKTNTRLAIFAIVLSASSVILSFISILDVLK